MIPDIAKCPVEDIITLVLQVEVLPLKWVLFLKLFLIHFNLSKYENPVIKQRVLCNFLGTIEKEY